MGGNFELFELFWRNFFGGIFLEEFFGRNFLQLQDSFLECFFLEIGRFKKRITLSEIKPPLEHFNAFRFELNRTI